MDGLICRRPEVGPCGWKAAGLQFAGRPSSRALWSRSAVWNATGCQECDLGARPDSTQYPSDGDGTITGGRSLVTRGGRFHGRRAGRGSRQPRPPLKPDVVGIGLCDRADNRTNQTEDYSMSSITAVERRVVEDLLGMASGYVLDFTDASYARFFRDYGVNIESQKYHASGRSKAKRMRTFWELEPDKKVGEVLRGLLAYIEACGAKGAPVVRPNHHAIVSRLLGGKTASAQRAKTEETFLAEEFGAVKLDKLKLEGPVEETILQRISEIHTCLKHTAPLAVVFLAGSALEALLLNAATRSPKAFNQAKAAPKDGSGKVRAFPDWKLNDLINVANECGVIGEDVKKFSHALREFRNYIHPYEQAQARFRPDTHTAQISWKVLRAAIADLSGER